MKKLFKILIKIIIFLFVVFVLVLATGFFAVKFNLTKTAGDVDENTGVYNTLAAKLSSSTENSFLPTSRNVEDVNDVKIYCKLHVLSDYADYNAATIFSVYQKNKSYELAEKMILALRLRLDNKDLIEQRLSFCDQSEIIEISPVWLAERLKNPKQKSVFSWQNEEPWQIIREAVIKDKEVLKKVGEELQISPRLLLSVAIVEQLRLYYTQRELFERVFKPLKILASANKMAWGVMSIKEAAAIKSEGFLKDKNSQFYLGYSFENILNFKTADPVKERYERLTDEKNHYYSYLYGGVIIKQAISQWQKAGFDISERPEILATLFNIGLQNSQPKSNPMVGGSKIDIGGSQYVFGSLAYEFYYSGDLLEEFPY
jgi:hypothetical protein